MPGKKKTLSSGDAAKLKAKPQRVKVDKNTKFRLEEMYMASASQEVGSTETRAYSDEESRIANLHPVKPSVDQDFYPEKFWEETPPVGKTVGELDDFLGVNPVQEKGQMDIPKMLPVPKGKTIDAITSSKTQTASKGAQNKLKTKQSQLTAKVGEEITSQPQQKELEFVLRCPLFPEQFPETSTPGLEFSSRVESFGLRVLPSVKTILSKTRPDLSNFFLQRWREKMIKELGEDGFKRHQEGVIIYLLI